MNFIKPIYEKLAGDTTLTNKLSTYKTKPAIFTIDPVPSDAELPYVIITGAVSQTPFDTKSTLGRQIWVDIRCYTKALGSVEDVDTLAERVRDLFHRVKLTSTGFTTITSIVDGYIVANDEYAYGRILTLKIVLEEK